MSSGNDDILLKKLQKTIDNWSSEVTGAHQKLTHQIGDAKTQLDTLIGVLGAGKAEGPGSSPQTQGTAPATAQPALEIESQPVDPPSTGKRSDGRIRSLERELEALQSTNEELTREIANRVYENRAAESELEVARNQLEEFERGADMSPEDVEALQQEIEHKASQLASAELEVKSLTTAIGTFKNELEMQLEVYEQRKREAMADLETADAFIDTQNGDLEELRGKLTTLSLRNEQFAETEEAIKAELKSARDDGQSHLQDLEQARQDENEVKEELDSIRRDYENQTEAMNELLRELEEARQGENELKEELDAIRRDHEKQTKALNESLQELEGVRQSKNQLKEELDAIRRDHEEQTKALNESLRELEAHWELAKETKEHEDSLKGQIQELETGLAEERNATVRAVEDLQSSQQQLVQQHQKHAEELEKLRDQNQEDIYSMLKTLGEHGLSQGDIDLALELKRKQAATQELEHSNAALRESLHKLETRLKDLEESDSPMPSNVGADRQPGRAEMEQLHAELTAFEKQLVERERAIEAAADKMRSLEETAIAVQAQVVALHTEHMAAASSGADGQDLAGAHREIDTLKYNLAEMTELKDAQTSRIREMEDKLVEQEDHGDHPGAEDGEALAVSEDMPHILNQALAEIDTLRKHLTERDLQIDELKQALAELEESEESAQMTFTARDANGQPRSMGEILIDAGIITSKQLESALDEQRTATKRRLGSILVEKGLIREEIVAQVVASQLNLPFVRLEKQKIEQGALALMDGRLATHHMCFPFSATTEKITVAMANPLDLIAIEDLEFATSLKVHPVVATLSDITSAIVKHYGVTIANPIAEDTFESKTPPKLPKKSTAPPVRKDH